MSFPIIISKCPVCGGKETVSQLAQREVFPKADIPTALEPQATQITNSVGDAGILPRAVVVSYDVCASCGTPYCVRADIVVLQQKPSMGVIRRKN